MEGNPKLRHVEAFPHEENGRRFVVLRDPTQISTSILAVPQELIGIISMFDGNHSVLDIQTEMTRRTGQIIFREQIEAIIEQLNKARFLDNEHFETHFRQTVANYREQSIRSACHAGLSYPAEPSELIDQLNSFYLSENGAGLPESSRGSTVDWMIVPHIDLRLGGPTYTHAYRALAESEAPDTFVILGTGHSGLPNLFSISKKSFTTPLGEIPPDLDFIQELEDCAGDQTFVEDLSHRNEHTIEFQLVFLKHLYPKRDFRIVPILCSFCFLDFEPGVGPRNTELLDRFIRGLHQAKEALGPDRRICFVASVDLAHVGPRYGDDFRPTTRDIETIKAKDLEMLELVARGDAEGFFEFVREELDSRKVCGFPAIYTLLNAFPKCRGDLLAHSHCQIDESGSIVTYASMAMRNEIRGCGDEWTG